MPTKKLQMLGYKIVPPEHVGLSAFEIAVENGFEGNEAEWLEYLATLKIHTISDIDLATAPGLYQIAEGSPETLPSQYKDFIHGTVFVEKNDDRIFQTINHENISAKRFNNLDEHTWSEWEFVNPPYLTDIEYRTTDRINDKAVYKKITPDGILRYRLDGEDTWQTYQESLGITQESLGITQDSLGISQESLGITQESLGITYESTGAAPAGYGYGGEAILLNDDPTVYLNNEDELTNAIEAVYSTMNNKETKLIYFIGYPSLKSDGTLGDYSFFGFLTKGSGNYGSLVAHCSYSRGCIITKTKYNSVWEPLEWVNPPFNTGVAYRTTDRINGTPVYKKVDSDGKLQYALGSATSEWNYYNEHVGAAPDGYGLGGVGALVYDVNTAINSGFYALAGDSTANVPSKYEEFKNGTLLVENRNDGLIKQTFFHNGISAIRYRYKSGPSGNIWSELEFINPPFEYDGENYKPVEYRTTKRINAKVVHERFMPDGDPDSTAWYGKGKMQYRLEGSTTWIDY